MPKYGMSLDNLDAAEIVLADGRIVRASESENADLFWAVRGGGGNFGVASSFEFRLHEVGPMVTGGLVAWPAECAHDVLRLFRDLASRAPDDLMLVAALITGPDGVSKLVAIAAGYFGTMADGERAVEPIKSFGQPAMEAMGPIPYSQLNAMLDGSYPRGARSYWKSRFIDDLSDASIEAIVASFTKCPSPMGQVVIEHFHGAATRIAPERTAYSLRGSGFNVLMLSQWQSPEHDTRGDFVGARFVRGAGAGRRVAPVSQLPRQR